MKLRRVFVYVPVFTSCQQNNRTTTLMEEPEEIHLIPLSVLTSRTRQVLSVNLNPLSGTIIPGCDSLGDYRGLAEQLGKPYTFGELIGQKRDPTGELLKSLKGPEATLTTLWGCLLKMGRTDVLGKCRELFIEDTKRWQNRKPRNRFEAEEIKNEKRRKDIRLFLEGSDEPRQCQATPAQHLKDTQASPFSSLADKPSQGLKHSSTTSPQTHNAHQQHHKSPFTSPQPHNTHHQLHTSPNTSPQPSSVLHCTEVKQEKKSSKIRAFFSQKIKFLPHSNPTKSSQRADQSLKPASSSSAPTSLNGCTQDLSGHSSNYNNKIPNGISSNYGSGNGTVKDIFSSLPSVNNCSGGSSGCSLPDTPKSSRSEILGQDTASGGVGYKSSLPEPLLTIEDGQYHKAMYDAYINSSEEDLLKAKEMLNILEAPPYSLRLFLPDRQLMPGGSRYEDIAGVVEERCHGKVVIILTRHYQNSEACHFVTNFARALDPAAQRKQIIPVEYEKIELPRMLKGMHIICKARDEQRGWFWNKLTEAIKQL